MIEYKKFVLDNGLIVLLHRDKTTPLCSLNILYNVGSKHEKPDMTGFAHLFEHLMFEGSINVKNFDIPIEKSGGNSNAFTNQDFTNYYITLPANNLEVALWLESDRMLGLDFSHKKLEIQKRVVIEEFKERYLNMPYGDIYHLLYDLSYEKHHYKWPTIGKDIKHIEGATLDCVKEFFYSHYGPNNAILALTGNIEYEETLKLIKKWFEEIPIREISKSKIPEEPEQTKEKRIKVHRDVPNPKLIMAFHMPARTHKDFYVYDLISDVLANGKSSMFFKNLIRNGEVFLQSDAYITGNIDNGLFIINTTIKDNSLFEKAEVMIYSELEKLITGLISEKELVRVKNKFEASRFFDLYELSSRSFYLSYFELLGDVELINSENEKYFSVELDDVIRVSKKLFDSKNRNVLYYMKEQ